MSDTIGGLLAIVPKAIYDLNFSTKGIYILKGEGTANCSQAVIVAGKTSQAQLFSIFFFLFFFQVVLSGKFAVATKSNRQSSKP